MLGINIYFSSYKKTKWSEILTTLDIKYHMLFTCLKIVRNNAVERFPGWILSLKQKVERALS